MAKKINEKTLAISPRQSLIKRMNVYFGPETGDETHPYSSQKSVLVREIPDNSVDILRKLGKGGTIRVTFNEDKSVEVYDNGSGIPVEISKTHDGIPASSLYLSLGVLNAGTNYENATSSIGTNGVGGSGAQMLSEYMKVEVYRDKQIYKLDFKEGKHGIFDDKGNFKEAKDLTFLKVEKDNRSKEEKKKFPTGTKILFKIDDTLFRSEYNYEIDYLVDVMKGTSFLDDNITFEIIDYQNKQENREPTKYLFNYGGGLEHIVDLQSSEKLTKIYSINNSSEFSDKTINVSGGKAKVEKIVKKIEVNAAFSYQNNYEYTVDSFVNTLKTRLHGHHVTAFENAFTQAFNDKLTSMRGYLSKNEKNLPIFQDYAEGLCLAISVNLAEPEFSSQTKEKLGGKAVIKILTKLFTESINEWLNDKKNQDDIKKIADKVMDAYKIRIKRKEEIDIKREKNKIERSSKMPSKLVDCEITHSEYSELYIAEGDSAKTPLVGARNSKYQAIIPIKGKILNVLKASPKEILQNKEVQDIIKCLDNGVGNEFTVENSRYQKVFIATDADPDGANICNLIITLFWKLFPDMIKQGKLYKVLTPLYIVRSGKEEYYCLDKEERDKVLSNLKSKNITIHRIKGLGEAGLKPLFVTGMNPETRRCVQINIDDIKKAEDMLELVMGNDPALRKTWLEQNPYIAEEEE